MPDPHEVAADLSTLLSDRSLSPTGSSRTIGDHSSNLPRDAEDRVVKTAASNAKLVHHSGDRPTSQASSMTTLTAATLFLTPRETNSWQTAAERPHEEQPRSATRSSQTKRAKRVSLLNSIDPRNIIEITDIEDEQSNVDTPPTSSVLPSSYSFRNRRTTQGKLVYDVKYHPMDDSIRPTQAAKRRSAHGETNLFSDDTSASFSVHVDSDEEGDRKESESEVEKPTRKRKKRARSRSQSARPTRRSSRKTAKPRMSYNTSIHPQDCDLEVSSADDSDCGAASNAFKRRNISRSVEETPVPLTDHHMKTRSIAFTHMNDDKPGHDMNNSERATSIKTSSPLSRVATPPPYGVRRKEGLDVWMLKPGERYFRHDRDSWPMVQGLPFEIYTERLEDQLAAEANAASPFNYEQDDKENNIVNSRLEETPNSTEGISVVPLSQHERARDGSAASNRHSTVNGAFYDTNIGSPYGLGSHDGVDEQDDTDTRAVSTMEAMRILASSEKMPRISVGASE